MAVRHNVNLVQMVFFVGQELLLSGEPAGRPVVWCVTSKLERRGRLAEARVALLEALDAVRDGAALEPGASSTRLVAMTRLACIAATLGDDLEARRYAREGLALWSETRLAAPATRGVQGFVRWESWARAFLARAAEDRGPGSIKLDFVEGTTDCPLLRLQGDNPVVIQALESALASVTGAPVALHALPGIKAVGGCHLTAVLGDRDRGVRRLRDLAFEWAMSAEGWSQVIGLLEPFESAAPGNRFQYLSREGEVAVLTTTDGHW